MTQARLLLSLVLLLLPATLVMAQSGKITGQVTDAASGEALPGVNVVIEGTTQGAVTNIDGYYVILNVRPGEYDLRASFIGYTPSVIQDIRVNIDLTTEINFQLQEETVGLDEVVVAATRPIVQRDVSASVANINQESIENLPVSSVAEVISLQAGFEPGLTVRGAGGNQVAFAVDGTTLTDPRSNNPNTKISFTAIEEVQVQTGGFNAEYGNVRSGLINVVTKDPSRTAYSADAIVRYSAPGKKYFTDFGSGYDDRSVGFNAYPRLSTERFPGDGNGNGTVEAGETCEVSICGVSILPAHLRTQYEQFGGWRALAAGTAYTPEQMRKGQEFVYRKDFSIDDPDYEIDGTITGPVPGISKYLGDLRFSGSFRRDQSSYVIPAQRTSEISQTFQGKLVSDLGTGMRLALSGLHTKTEGIAFTGEGMGYINVTSEMPGYTWDDRNYIEGNLPGFQDTEVWGDFMFSPHDNTLSTYGAEFTHTLSPSTFYEVKLQRSSSEDLTGAPTYRTEDGEGNSLIIACVTPSLEIRETSDGSCASNEISMTEQPFGYKEKYEYYGGQAWGSQRGDARDTSDVVRWNARFDITSQVNRFMQLKAGAEFNYSDYNVSYGSWDPANPHQENERYNWDRSPVQGGLYGQTRLEFKGMVANIGLRLDYFHAGGEWYDYDAFSRIFSSTLGFDVLEEQETSPTQSQVALSPRLGVSFPVTDNSKFYFNYGHFRQMPDPYRLFEIRYGAYTTQIQRIGNPNINLPKTVAYELGFEQNIANRFLVRLAGFYRDLTDGGRDVRYVSIDDLVDYTRQEPLGYGDYRGFEVTLEKNQGQWVRGFINYTYLATKNGNFGWGTIFEDLRRYREFIRNDANLSLDSRVPEPYANANIEFHLPNDIGPSLGGTNLLGDWRIALLGTWRAGAPTTWDGNTLSIRGQGNDRRISYNTKWKDYWNFDMRLSKNFKTAIGDAQFYVDVTNVFNIRQMYNRRGTIFQGDNDTRDYMRSLHLPGPEDLFEGIGDPNYTPSYSWVPGDDKPGDYRKPGVAFDPIYAVTSLSAVSAPIANALYYDLESGKYMTYANGAWGNADDSRVKQVLDDKAYIDMPNGHVVAFMNPRNVFFGIRLSF